MNSVDATPSPLPMPEWLAPFERLADRSPIAVRQLRQQLRGKAWSISLITIPALCLIGALGCFATQHQSSLWLNSSIIPRVLFGGYLLVWAVMCGVIQPGGAGRALRRERIDQTWDLIELAGLGGYHIAVGFWCAALVQIILMSALFAPFLVMAWLLRGVDTGALLIALVAVPAWGALVAAFAVYSASGPLPKKKNANRMQAGAEVVGLLFGAPLFIPLMLPGGASSFLRGFGGGAMAIGITCSIWLLLVVGCLVHAGTALAHPARNRSTGPRLVAWLAALIIVIWGMLLAPFTRNGLSTAAILITLISIWTGLGAIAEYDGTTPRQQRWLNEARGFWKHTAWFLGPGCRRGRRCVLLLAALGLGCAVGSGQDHIIEGCIALVAYAMTFFVIGDVVTRRLISPSVHRPRVQTVTTVIIAVGVHVLGGLIAWTNNGNSDVARMLLPIGAISSLFTRGNIIDYVSPISVMGLISVIILIVQACRREHNIIRLVGDAQGER